MKVLLKASFPFLFFLTLNSGTFSQAPGAVFFSNSGQWEGGFDFRTSLPDGQFFAGPAEFRYLLYDGRRLADWHAGFAGGDEAILAGKMDLHAVRVAFEGADRTASVVGRGRLPYVHHYFLGRSASADHIAEDGGPQADRWVSEVPAFDTVVYQNLYPNTDLLLYRKGEVLKYDVVVGAGGNPAAVRLRFEGADSVVLREGALWVYTGVGNWVEERPVAFQHGPSGPVPVACQYVLEDKVLGFDFPEGYDASKPLMLDPAVIFASWSGSTGENWACGATHGRQGALYAAGVGLDFGWPVTTGAYQSSFAGLHRDVVISKYESDGSTLLYATYLGGSSPDRPLSLVANERDELVVLGVTQSADFPIGRRAYDSNLNGGDDLFLVRLSQNGNQLLGGTYLGGSANEGALEHDIFDGGERSEVVLDRDGFVYVASGSFSADFPVSQGAFQVAHAGNLDGVVYKMRPDLQAMEWSSFIGGSNNDMAYGLRVDSLGQVFVCGGTNSPDFPVHGNAYQSQHGGDWDAWVAKIAPDGRVLQAATLMGKQRFEQALMLDLGPDGQVYITGQSTDPAFPVSTDAHHDPGGKNFICRFSADLSALTLSTAIGSGDATPDLTPLAFMVDACGKLYFSGSTTMQSRHLDRLPVTGNAFQQHTDFRNLYMMVLSEHADQLLFGTYFGGQHSHDHSHGRCARFDSTGMLYQAYCSGCQLRRIPGTPFPGTLGTSFEHDGSLNDLPVTHGAFAPQKLTTGCDLAALKVEMGFWKIKPAMLVSDEVVCQGDTVWFEEDGQGGKVWTWHFGDGHLLSGNKVWHQYAEPGEFEVQLNVFDNRRCIEDAAVGQSILVKPIPQLDAGPDVMICPGGSVPLQVEGEGDFFWQPASWFDNPMSQHPVLQRSVEGQISVEMEDSSGCRNSDTLRVQVQAVKAAFSFGPGEVTTLDRIVFQNLSLGDQWHEWGFGNGHTGMGEFVAHQFEAPGSYPVELKIEGPGGCRDSVIHWVEVVPHDGVFIPNAFSPNGDLLNDQFKVGGSVSGDFRMEIFDRYGRQIFLSNDPEHGWDGTAGGEHLPEGAYVFRIRLRNHADVLRNIKGTVLLIR